MAVLPDAGYACDGEGRITSFNQKAGELWGRWPALNSQTDRYCGSYRLFTVDGARVPHDRCWMALTLREGRSYNRQEIVIERPDGSRRVALAHANPVHDERGRMVAAVNILVDITDRKHAEDEVRRLNATLEQRVQQRTGALEAKVRELQQALEKIKMLYELIPICSWCRKVRDDRGYWQGLEEYLHANTGGKFTHGICPDCVQRQHDNRRVKRTDG